MASLTAQDIKILETTRQRLAQVTSQLANLQHQLTHGEGDPLPKWTSLHTQSLILSQSLATLSSHISANSTFFDSAAVYPLPSFPGREQEMMLHSLVGKKLAAPTADWLEEGQRVGEALVEQTAGMGSEQEGGEGWKRLWEWAAIEANDFARGHEWGMEDEDEDEEDEEGEGVGEKGKEVDGMNGVQFDAKAKPLSVEYWDQFMTKGYYEKKLIEKKDTKGRVIGYVSG